MVSHRLSCISGTLGHFWNFLFFSDFSDFWRSPTPPVCTPPDHPHIAPGPKAARPGAALRLKVARNHTQTCFSIDSHAFPTLLSIFEIFDFFQIFQIFSGFWEFSPWGSEFAGRKFLMIFKKIRKTRPPKIWKKIKAEGKKSKTVNRSQILRRIRFWNKKWG